MYETIGLTFVVNNLNFNLIASYNTHFEYRHLKHLEFIINMFPASSKTCIIGDLNQDLLTNKGELLLSSLSDSNLQNFI